MRVLVIDDDPKITALLRRALTFEGYEVITAASGQEGIDMALQENPDLVVLDIMLPGLDGWEVCRQLRQHSTVPILMLTARDEVADRVKGLNLGADDYLVKPFALEELLARVHAMLRRSKQLEEAGRRLRFADLTLDLDSREARRGERTFALTAKEFDLLKLFMENPRRVLARDMIMDRIWGYDYSGESNVLEVYIGMLRQKLEEKGEARLIHTVRGVGYVLREIS
ncbi:response regulator transcription factor [Desulfurispora thermophila]|uniref:response regulator transcription factor n=1 Tax=Desulfurispora thermophila TaxID=265470 RepID=UPI00036D2891|nr:response regulator transcription factor [Desulfurispora thermophila]